MMLGRQDTLDGGASKVVYAYTAFAVTVSGDALNLLLHQRKLRSSFFRLCRYAATVSDK